MISSGQVLVVGQFALHCCEADLSGRDMRPSCSLMAAGTQTQDRQRDVKEEDKNKIKRFHSLNFKITILTIFSV